MPRSCSSRSVVDSTNSWSNCFQDTKPVKETSGSPWKVRFGQRTFDAEGLESSGQYFSRRITFPGGDNSGVTVGRGYDMGRRSAATVLRELTFAGVPHYDATQFSRAAGLRGGAAERFVLTNREDFPELSPETQKKLFEDVVTPDLIGDIKRIFNKPDTVKAYGRPDWESLSPAAQELVFDLRYRGDYTSTTRQRVQKLLVDEDYEGLKAVMNDTAYWAGLKVPAGRIKERQKMAELL